MRFLWTARTGILALALLLTACAARPEEEPSSGFPTQIPGKPEETGSPTAAGREPAPETPPVGPTVAGGETAGLIQALQADGAQVERGQAIDQPFFSGTGWVLQVDAQEIQVFEYETEAQRESDSSAIASDGGSIGSSMPAWVDQPNFWARGKLIVLYVGRDQAILQRLERVLGQPLTQPAALPEMTLPATVPSPTETPEGAGPSGPYPRAIQAAIQNLVELLATPAEQVQVSSYEQVQWPDSCLGLSKRGEMCLQVITPGWRVILNAGGQQYEYHTDDTGDRLRMKPLAVPQGGARTSRGRA